MIFDWIRNSEKIIRERRLSDSDDWEARRKWTQECAMLRYARHTLGWDPDRCRELWAAIPNGMASVFSYDRTELEGAWANVWEAAVRLGPLKPLPRVKVTEGDVAFLDSLEAPFWVRGYWMSLLVWIRTMRSLGEAAEYDGHVNAWLIRRVAPGKGVSNVERTLARWSRACGRPFPLAVVPSGKGTKAVYVLDGRFGGGDVVAEVTMDGLDEAVSLLEEKAFVCASCGRRFDSGRFGRRKLCEACGIKARLVSNKMAHRKYDQKKSRTQADSHQ